MEVETSKIAKKCVLYARVSTEEQTEKFGLSSQLSELRSYAKKAGYRVLCELIDDGYSGADLGRPGLDKLRELVRSKTVGAVLVHDPDRLARKLAHQLLLIDECEKAETKLEFLSTPNAEGTEGRLLLNVRGVIAEYEREKIRERTMRGRREKARQGFVVGGRRPYGYTVVNGNYQIEDREAKIVAQIFGWLVEERLSIRQIVERLNQRGFRPHTSTRWAKSSVGRILRNELYIGKGFYNRRQRAEPPQPRPGFRRNKKTIHRWRPETEWITQECPAILAVDVFHAAQERLKENSAHCSGRPSKHIYLLRGILRCAMCGRKYVGVPVFGDKYYRCIARERLAEPRCDAPIIAAAKVETFVWNYIVRLLSNPDLLVQKLAEQGTGDRDLERELAHIDEQIVGIRRKQEKLLQAMLDDSISLPGMREKATELEQQRLGWEKAKQQVQTGMAMQRDQTQLRETVLRYCKILGNRVESLNPEARQKLLRALVDEVTLRGEQVSLKGILPASLPSEYRPQREHIMIAGRGDFERALGHGLSPHVAKVRVRGIFAVHVGERRRRGRQRIRLI